MLLLLGTMQFATAASPEIVGRGCTTAFFIDKDCKGVGVGMKASGIYPLSPGARVGTHAWYTMGDMPDPDPTDPSIRTEAQWQAKWGKTNAGMVNFLQQRKGFTNTRRIWYVSRGGNNATGVTNDPMHPFRTM